MNNPLPLTIVTAVLNEEKILPGFLDHVLPFAQEVIVVVDYRTTDKSAEIAKERGCKVLIDKGESEGVVFNNKNWGIEEAKFDWVLILDADERMDETLQKEITDVVEGRSKNPQAVMYQTGFINYEFGKYFTKCDQPKKKFIRLVKKGSFKYNTGKTAEGFGIHQQENSKLKNTPGLRSYFLGKNPKIDTFKGLLLHNSHPTISDFLRKIDLYSTREAKIYLQNHKNISSFSIFFKMIFWTKREFIYKYFVWKFYKEGMHGFIASVIYAYYHFLIAAKIYVFHYKNTHEDQIKQMDEKYNFSGHLDSV